MALLGLRSIIVASGHSIMSPLEQGPCLACLCICSTQDLAHSRCSTNSHYTMNDCLMKSVSSSWSKPYLNCSGLPDRKRFLLFQLDDELVQPREESSLPAPGGSWRPPRPLSPGNVGVGGRSLPSFVFVSVDYFQV